MTASAFHTRPLRFILWSGAALWSAALLAAGGCSPDTSSPATPGTGSGGAAAGSMFGPTAGNQSSAGKSTGGGVSNNGGAGNNTVAGSSGNNTGNGGIMNTGGVNGGGATTGGGGSAQKPCVDVEPPPDPEWPGATCDNWVNEANACGEPWFSTFCDVTCGRCVPEGGGGSGGGPPAVDCSTMGLPNVTSGNGYATRYWDCCQPHCAQSNGHRCSQDGTSQTGNTQSACSGGGAYACYDEAPKAISECVSHGHIAKANPNCGQCYRIQFTGQGEHNANDPGSKLIKGKQMIVKVSNTGGDVAANQFDLMIPGGGVGQFNACSQQWGTSDLGAQYGGFLTECSGSHAQKKECVRQECMKIPAGSARDGCIWFVDWLQVADNPKFTSEQTNCPF